LFQESHRNVDPEISIPVQDQTLTPAQTREECQTLGGGNGVQFVFTEEEPNPTESSSSSQQSVVTHPSNDQTPPDRNTDTETVSLELELIRQEEARKQLQRENEINAAVRCLTTNLILYLVFFVLFLFAQVLNETVVVVALATLLKAIVPIIATIANFVKISTLLSETFLSLKNKLSGQTQ
jgi:hypothetical protein